ncbi:hypothetical protein ACFY8K_16820 [Streptomyces misionensis]|uniref:hypothetical protein n=1 Tax=Streptomyces misionensis TaxID=67331 RepID=UPI0036AE1321
MSARADLLREMTHNHLYMTDERANELIDAFAHELAERLRSVHGSGEGDAWNWWDAADIPGACADLIDPHVSATPVRPDEEPTT